MPRKSTRIKYVQRETRTYAVVHEIVRTATVNPTAVAKDVEFTLRLRLPVTEGRKLRPRMFIMDGSTTVFPHEVKRRVTADGVNVVYRFDFEGLPNTSGANRNVEVWIVCTTRSKHTGDTMDKNVAARRTLTVNA